MTKKERLFETFGELLYVVAMADGVIQPEEFQALENIIKNHPLSETIKWSFNYEKTKGQSIEELYNKVISDCHHNGPDPDYEFFISSMKTLADANNGTSQEEDHIIKNFSKDLLARFQRDLEK